jgi:two-component system invasion response regulator UvrY
MTDSNHCATVLIAEDHVLVGEGIAMALSPYFAIAGSVRSLSDLVPTIQRCRPDVVILDISFGADSSIPVMRKICQGRAPRPRFVMLTAHESPALFRAAFGAGATGFVLKGSSMQDLRLAVEAAVQGRRFVSGSANARDTLPQIAAGPRARLKVGGIEISQRQAEILTLFQNGLSREEVAEHFDISLKGLEYHLSEIQKTSGFPRLPDMLRWWKEEGPAARRGMP